jgi:hypothetical protein
VFGCDDFERNQATETSINLPTKRRTVIPKRTKMMIIDITGCFPPFESATGESCRQIVMNVKHNNTFGVNVKMVSLKVDG